jgi:hypothetical protein
MMTESLLLKRLNKILLYCKKNHIRLLIEADPEYTKLHIYIDDEHKYQIIKQMQKYGIEKHYEDKGVKLGLVGTNEKIYYLNKNPVLKLLDVKKDKLMKRFYNSDTKVDIEHNGKETIYYVSVHGEFEEFVRVWISELLKEEGIEKFVKNYENHNFPDNYKLNRLGHKRLAVYRY